MIVYDVVRYVVPGTPCSYPKGRTLVNHFDKLRDAELFACRCNECVMVDGIRYDVVAVDELDPAREYDNHPAC